MCESRNSCVEIDLNGIKDIYWMHQLLKEKLGFPDFYGNNWHAFWDAITGLVELPEKLIVVGWKHICEILPDDAKYFRYYMDKYNTIHAQRDMCNVVYID